MSDFDSAAFLASDEIAALKADRDRLAAELATRDAMMTDMADTNAKLRAELSAARAAIECAVTELEFYGPAEYAGKARKILRDAIGTAPSALHGQGDGDGR